MYIMPALKQNNVVLYEILTINTVNRLGSTYIFQQHIITTMISFIFQITHNKVEGILNMRSNTCIYNNVIVRL